MTAVVATNETILVVGGGISGVTAALEAAECGKDVVLVEKQPTLGTR
jgi:quinone-modifying oxidoreductase subunit QmoA